MHYSTAIQYYFEWLFCLKVLIYSYLKKEKLQKKTLFNTLKTLKLRLY
jgi:hypothetical protein